MLEFISIKELTKELGYKDSRSAVRWCENNGVGILSDSGSKRQYVIKAEFIVKYMNESVKYIQQKYGKDKLPEFFNSSMKFFAEYNQANDEKKKEYKPQGKYEIEFLSILQKLTPPL